MSGNVRGWGTSGAASITVDTSDLDRAMAQMTAKGWEAAALPTTRNIIRKSINVVRKNIRAQAKPHRRSGRMSGNVRTRFSQPAAGWKFEGSTKATGAPTNLIVGGVKPHPIAAGGAVMPMWGGHGKWRKGNGAGVTGFARKVSHPGFPADPFVDRGIAASKPAIDGFTKEGAATIAREYAYRMERR